MSATRAGLGAGEGLKDVAPLLKRGLSLPAFSPESSTAPGVPAPPLDNNPVVFRVRELCVAGELSEAVVFAFDRAVTDTVRQYGLEIPPSCTSLEFVSEHLRTDMGNLGELLPELYRLYEPVRFGGVPPAGPRLIQQLVDRIYTETALARAYDPLFQSKGPTARVSRETFSVSRTSRSPTYERSWIEGTAR